MSTGFIGLVMMGNAYVFTEALTIGVDADLDIPSLEHVRSIIRSSLGITDILKQKLRS